MKPRRVPGPEERGVRAERAREKILQAAAAEFGAKGYAGARTADIAARAGVNSQLISYYFDGKQGLLDELRRRFQAVAPAAVQPDTPFAEEVRARLDAALDHPDWTRMAAWQELGDCPFARSEDQEAFTQAQRSAMAEATERMRLRQRAGEVTGEITPEFALLVVWAMTLAPVAMPRLARDILGEDPLSPAVRQRLSIQLVRLLRGAGN